MASTLRHSPDGQHDVPSSGAEDDGGQRGSLRIGDKVAERLAVLAAISTPGVRRHAGGLDKITGRDLPSARLVIASNRAAAQVKVAVDWPQPLVEVARAVQRNVTDALATMAGLGVDRVDVEVSHVVADGPSEPTRRVQ